MRKAVAIALLAFVLMVSSATASWAHDGAGTRGDFELGQLVVALVPLVAGALGIVASNAVDTVQTRSRVHRARHADRGPVEVTTTGC